jgi:hypothetical protein
MTRTSIDKFKPLIEEMKWAILELERYQSFVRSCEKFIEEYFAEGGARGQALTNRTIATQMKKLKNELDRLTKNL